MKTHYIQTDRAPKALGPYSQGVKAGNIIFISGSLGIDPVTGKLKESFTDQVEQSIKNIQAILNSQGLSLEAVTKTTVFLSELSDFNEFNRTYERYFGKAKPARSTVEVSKLPLQALVEIEAIAVTDNNK